MTLKVAELSKVRFAAVVGLTTRQITNLRDKGLPCRTEGNRVMIPVPEGIKWYIAFKAAALQPMRPTTLDDAKQRREAALAGLAELDLAERQGELMTVVEYERMLSGAMERMASKLRNLPHKVATQVTGKTMDARKAQAARLVDEVYRELHDADDVPEAVA